MYTVVGYSPYSGSTVHTQWQPYSSKLGFMCEILDTDDMVVDSFTSDELYELLKRDPGLEISGIKHECGVFRGIYAPMHRDYTISGDYCIVWDWITDRGSFARVKVYKRGYSELAGSFDTQHHTGTDVDIEVKGVLDGRNGHKLSIMCKQAVYDRRTYFDSYAMEVPLKF